MGRIKDVITIPFRSCRKSTTATARRHHATVAAAPLVAASDDDDATSPSTPHIVLRMHLHCASCAAKIERVVMDIPGVEEVATDVEASRVTVTGTANAAAVATSVQVRTRKPVTVVMDGRSAREQSATTARARTPHEDQARVGGTSAATAQVRPVPAMTAAAPQEEEEIARRPAQEQEAEWTAEVRIAGLQCGNKCMGRIVQRVSGCHGVREIKLTLPDRANDEVLRCRRSSSGVRDTPRE